MKLHKTASFFITGYGAQIQSQRPTKHSSLLFFVKQYGSEIRNRVGSVVVSDVCFSGQFTYNKPIALDRMVQTIFKSARGIRIGAFCAPKTSFIGKQKIPG